MDTEDLNTMPPSEIHVKKVRIKRDGHFKRKNELVFTCRTDEILQEKHPFSTAAHKAEGDFRQESQHKSSEEKEEAQDQSPVVETRQDF